MVWYDKHTSDNKAERSKITEQPPQGCGELTVNLSHRGNTLVKYLIYIYLLLL